MYRISKTFTLLEPELFLYRIRLDLIFFSRRRRFLDVLPTIISQVSNVKRKDHLTFLGVVFLHFLYVVPANSWLKYIKKNKTCTKTTSTTRKAIGIRVPYIAIYTSWSTVLVLQSNVPGPSCFLSLRIWQAAKKNLNHSRPNWKHRIQSLAVKRDNEVTFLG